MRLLFVIDELRAAGGTERHLVELVRGLVRRRFTCAVVSFSPIGDDLAEALQIAGAQVTSIVVGRVYSWEALRQGWRLAQLIREGRYDLVQTFHQKADTFGALIAWAAGSKRIVSSRRDTGQFRGRAYARISRLLSPLYDRVIVVADHLGPIFVATDALKPEQIVRIYNGVDLNAFRPPTSVEAADQRARLGLEPGDFVVGMVANFRPEKNHHILFAAAEGARRDIPELKLLLVGGGARLGEYQAKFSGPGVVYTGPVADVRPYLSAMDVGCLISSTEGFSNAALEFMAMGLPMVVTEVGGNAEAVAADDTGLLIPAGDPEALRQAITRLHRDRKAGRLMGARARRVAEQRFSLDFMCDSYAALYRGLVGSGTPAGAGHRHA